MQVAFANMVRRTDFQPGGAPNDGVLNLTKMWGYAVNLPGGGATNTLEFDDVQVYENLQISTTSRARTRSRIPARRCQQRCLRLGRQQRAARRRCRSRSSTGRRDGQPRAARHAGSPTPATAASATTSRRAHRRTGAASPASSSGSTATTRAATRSRVGAPVRVRDQGRRRRRRSTPSSGRRSSPTTGRAGT